MSSPRRRCERSSRSIAPPKETLDQIESQQAHLRNTAQLVRQEGSLEAVCARDWPHPKTMTTVGPDAARKLSPRAFPAPPAAAALCAVTVDPHTREVSAYYRTTMTMSEASRYYEARLLQLGYTVNSDAPEDDGPHMKGLQFAGLRIGTGSFFAEEQGTYSISWEPPQ